MNIEKGQFILTQQPFILHSFIQTIPQTRTKSILTLLHQNHFKT